MLKRYLIWGFLIGSLSFLLSQFLLRPDLRSYFSPQYWQSMHRYGKVLRIVQAEFVDADEVSFKTLTDAALRGAVRSLDRYSDYMKAEDYLAFNLDANQEYVGIGVEVSQFSGRTIITRVFEQGGAAAGGLLSGDFIVAVDGEDVREESLGAIVGRIRGEAGTTVMIEVERPLTSESQAFEIERQAIALHSVTEVQMKNERVGYLRISQFTEATDTELATAVETLMASGMKALVIDLRDNPGGRLDSAARIAERFLEPGQTILTVQSRRGVEQHFLARNTPNPIQLPVALLINGNSASASEILAGALRDHQRAILIGETSYGKGTVQNVYGFGGGDGLKITSARYLLPSGEAINGTGVRPNIEVISSQEETVSLMLQKHHLRNRSASEFKRAFGFSPIQDSQLAAAVALMDAAEAQ